MSYVKLNSLQSDSSSQITSARTRLRNVYLVAGTTAGFIRIRDGGSTGDVRFEIATPAVTAEETISIELPKDGVLCETSMYIEIDTNVTSATLVFDGTLTPILELGAGGWIHLGATGAPLELAA